MLSVNLQIKTKRQEKLYRTLIFVSKILIAGLIFRGIIYLNPGTYSLQSLLASTTSELLKITGVEAHSEGINVNALGYRYIITQDCLGWKSMAVFGSIVAATPKRKKIRFLIAGLSIIFLANIARIITTVHLDLAGILSFDTVHGTLWRWGLTAVVMTLWIGWFLELPERINISFKSGRI